MKRILSGIKSSGDVTLGNYLGAMRRWAETQDRGESFFFVPDLHVLNMRELQAAPDEITRLCSDSVRWLLACGVDPKRSTIFLQSSIPAHSELAWILENYTYTGELNRMTQFKDKQQKAGNDPIPAGLYTYPVLMAADILLYDSDEVPVGEDQKQHVELTRNIAQRFNALYGETFKLPEPTLQAAGARIMNLQEPTTKMSKSDSGNKGNVLLRDDADTIKTKIMAAVTDSDNEIVYDKSKKPGIANLLEIAAVLSGQSPSELEQQYARVSYGQFKEAVAELVVESLRPIQAAFAATDEAAVKAALKEGKERAAPIASQKLKTVKQKIGLLTL